MRACLLLFLTLLALLPAGLAWSISPTFQLHLSRSPARATTCEMQMELKAPGQLVASTLAAVFLLSGSPLPTLAVSGGVADFGEIAGQDMSGGDYSKKDFSGANAKGTNLAKSKLKGARFFKADLTGADFTGSDLTAASLENAKLDGVVLTNAVLKGAYTGTGLERAKDISGSDWTDAQLRPDVQVKLCKRSDATGTNPKTQADTRESLGCP
eukprot:CAMPEP_0196734964 /NCGR_PEP_ID=MMETSP1091-20130531/13546_1 /TAXON_ID=302021 /ORGANISM="Rhodomonas sp., Strain CCMP768" /LENGTH=211 /DNA_ID=CAMNT_0042078547 /DNA_START=26 /DNA_END=661 /DNA_ORIENTATION=+